MISNGASVSEQPISVDYTRFHLQAVDTELLPSFCFFLDFNLGHLVLISKNTWTLATNSRLRGWLTRRDLIIKRTRDFFPIKRFNYRPPWPGRGSLLSPLPSKSRVAGFTWRCENDKRNRKEKRKDTSRETVINRQRRRFSLSKASFGGTRFTSIHHVEASPALGMVDINLV